MTHELGVSQNGIAGRSLDPLGKEARSGKKPLFDRGCGARGVDTGFSLPCLSHSLTGDPGDPDPAGVTGDMGTVPCQRLPSD